MKKTLLLSVITLLSFFNAESQVNRKCYRANGSVINLPVVEQEGKYSYDLGIKKHFLPLFIKRNTSCTISGIIHNYGNTNIVSMRLNYSVNGGKPFTNIVNSINIAPKSDYQFNHAIAWTPAKNGKYLIKIWADQLNGNNDENPSNDTVYARVDALETVATKMPLYEVFKQASCDPCYLACWNLEPVMSSTKGVCNPIIYHADWPGRDYMNDVTDFFDSVRVDYYGVENWGVPDGQLDGTTTTDNYDPSSITVSNITTEANLGSPFDIGLTATYNSSTNEYTVGVTVKSYIATKSTMQLKVRAVLTVDTIKYSQDQSFEDPQSAFAPPLGSTPLASGGDTDNSYKYVTDFPYVAEEMLPVTAGTALTPFSVNQTQTVNLTWTKNHAWGFCPKGNCTDNGPTYPTLISTGDTSKYDSTLSTHITVFVQSDSSKYVYQSASIIPSAPTSVNELSTGAGSLRVYPNPFNNETHVVYNLSQSQNVTIEVWNIMGQKVVEMSNGRQTEGQHEVIINKGNMQPGMYFLRLVTDGDVAVQKIEIE
ncbi:MAG: T9SS type A sorting domain-containing protein [Bacteroidia bacterium]